MNNILEPFFQMLTEEGKQYVYFQQDTATSHTSQCSVEVICEAFGERMVIWRPWPLLATCFMLVSLLWLILQP
jgi:hypothetical protein